MSHENNAEAADRLICQIDRLHSSPKIAQEILSLTRDSDFEMRDVVACLEQDPALAAKLLRMVNSSRYGLAHRVTSIRHAAAYLGRRSLRLTTLTFALFDSLARGAAGKLYADFWKRSLTMASVCSRLARQDSDMDVDDAYTAGLMADIGVLVFTQFEAERYQGIYWNSSHNKELMDAEQELFGFSHPFLGARLLRTWELPDPITDAINSHHESAADLESLDLAVCAANLVADALWQPECPHVLTASRVVQTSYHLDLDGFIDLAISCQSDIAEIAGVFGIEGFDALDCERFNQEARRVHAAAALESAMEIDELESAIDDLCR